jgi:dihydroflavonol-4-reductase
MAAYPKKMISEDMWNTTSTVNHNPYNYSKTVAEKLAWDMSEKQERWKLVVINPSFVMGPTLSKTSTSGTHGMIGQMADGTMKSGAAPFEIGMVDIKDVTEAHFNAAYLKDASGRHILSNKTLSMVDLANIIRNKFGDKWLLPKKAAPKWLIWLIGPIIDKSISRKMISNNMGYPWLANNSKSINELGIKYSPLEDCIESMFQQMIDNGIAKKSN